MELPLIKLLENDCKAHGRGRKSWWAKYLDVPPLTLSHWFAGRQTPNGERAILIYEKLNEIEKKREASQWIACLWGLYYNCKGTHHYSDLLQLIIPKCLAVSLDSRTLALLSYFVESEDIEFVEVADPRLSNRIGWLLEVSGKKTILKVHREIDTQPILSIAMGDYSSLHMKRYIQSQQTVYGKKWKIFDCDLSHLKESLA